MTVPELGLVLYRCAGFSCATYCNAVLTCWNMFTVFLDFPTWIPRWATIRSRLFQIPPYYQQRSARSLHVPRRGVQDILAIPAMSRLCSWGMLSLGCESVSGFTDFF
jgi:hypothetical protein